MSDDKQKTRAQLLGELESIKDLLNEEDELLGLEPPLLTVHAEDEEEAPLLTDVHLEPLAEEEEVEAELDQAPESDNSRPGEPITTEAEESPHSTEEQPSLFDARDSESESPKKPPTKSPPLSSGRGENPFLPKHIRDRLTANRPSQPPMVDYFAPLPTKAPLPAAPSSLPAEPLEPTDQQLVDELVKRFLPEIEAALRERLQSIVREQSGSHETESED